MAILLKILEFKMLFFYEKYRMYLIKIMKRFRTRETGGCISECCTWKNKSRTTQLLKELF